MAITKQLKLHVIFRVECLLSLVEIDGADSSESKFLDKTLESLSGNATGSMHTALHSLQQFLIRRLEHYKVVKHFQESELFIKHIRPHIYLSEHCVSKIMGEFYEMHGGCECRPNSLSKSRKIWVGTSNTLVTDLMAKLVHLTNVACMQQQLETSVCSLPKTISLHKGFSHSVPSDSASTNTHNQPIGEWDILYAIIDTGSNHHLKIIYCSSPTTNGANQTQYDGLQNLIQSHFFGETGSQDLLERFVLGDLY